ncbi:hypothetical protein ACJX0J_020853 [Zea mays]
MGKLRTRVTKTHYINSNLEDLAFIHNALLVGQQENKELYKRNMDKDATHISQKLEMLDNRWASKEMIVVPLILYWEDDLQSTSLQEDNCSWFPYSLSRGGDSAMGAAASGHAF